MMKQHLRMHGQTWRVHFRNNWRFSIVAMKAAAYTLGHGFTPRVSGKRASQLHDELWDMGRILSIEDVSHRLRNGLYVDRADAVRDFEAHAELYNETPRLEPFRSFVEAHFDAPPVSPDDAVAVTVTSGPAARSFETTRRP